jgi:hypothetical protein
MLAVLCLMQGTVRRVLCCMGLQGMGPGERGARSPFIYPRNQALGSCIAMLACLTGFSLTCRASAHFEGMAMEPGFSIKGISVPIASNKVEAPQLTMKVEEISMQPAKVGVLKIALIPQVVFKNLKLAVNPKNSTSVPWSRAMAAFMKENGVMDHAVIQGIEIFSTEGAGPHVKAREGKFLVSSETIRLLGVEMTDQDGGRYLPDASLLLEGPSAGSLVWKTSDGIHSMPILANKS